MTPTHRTAEPVTAVCAAMYAADLVPAYAFVFRVAATDSRFTVYAAAEDRYHIGDEYLLVLAARDAVPLPLTRDDTEFLRHCLHNAERRWREAIAEAAAGADRPAHSRPASPGSLDVEPTPAGYRHARRLFADELGRVERLGRLLDQHLGTVNTADADGGQP